MKKLALVAMVLCGLAAVSLAQQPSDALVTGLVTAYNSKDAAYFDKMLAADVVWLDEDGHAITPKQRVLGFLKRQLDATPSRKLTATKVKVSSGGDVAWASFEYMIEREGGQPLKGLNTTIFKKAGADWQIIHVHGAVNTKAMH